MENVMNNVTMPETINVGDTVYIREDAAKNACDAIKEAAVTSIRDQIRSEIIETLIAELHRMNYEHVCGKTYEVTETPKPAEEEKPVGAVHPNKPGKKELYDADKQKAIVDEYFANKSATREFICDKYHISETTLNRYIARYSDGRTKAKGPNRKSVPHAPSDTKPITKETYDEIKSMYEKGGVTQKELAEMFDLSAWRISNICRGLPTLMVEEFYKEPTNSDSININEADFKQWNSRICSMAKTAAEFHRTSVSDILKDAYGVMNAVYGIVWAQEKKEFFEDQGRSPFSTRELIFWMEKKNPATVNLLSSIINGMYATK